MAKEYINTSEYEKYFSEHLDDVHIAEILNTMRKKCLTLMPCLL